MLNCIKICIKILEFTIPPIYTYNSCVLMYSQMFSGSSILLFRSCIHVEILVVGERCSSLLIQTTKSKYFFSHVIKWEFSAICFIFLNMYANTLVNLVLCEKSERKSEQPPSIPIHTPQPHLQHITAHLFVVKDSSYNGTQEMKCKFIFMNAIKRASEINGSNKVQGSKQ